MSVDIGGDETRLEGDCFDNRSRRDVDRSRVKGALTCGGIGSVESITDLRALGVGFDSEIKGGVIESTVDGKSGVANIVLQTGAVDSVRSWTGVIPQGSAIGIDSIGVAGELGGVGIELRKDDDPGWALLCQREVFATGTEAEVGVKFVSFIGAVFSGSKDDQVICFIESGCWKPPLGEVVGVVGEVVVVENGGGRAGVVNLNPIGGITVFV